MKVSKRVLGAWAAVLLAIGSLTACGAGDDEGTAGSLVIGLQDPGSALPIFIAQREGFFEDHGIDEVKLQYFTQVTAMTAALSAGQIDAALQGISVVGAYNASTSGDKFQYFAPTALNETYLLAREGTDIPPMTETNWKDTVREFQGRSIGVTVKGGFGDLYIRYLAEQVGLDPDEDMTLVAVGIGETAKAAIESGQVDVVPEIARGTAMQVADGTSYVISDLVGGTAPGPFVRMFGGGLFATESGLDKSADDYAAVGAALADAREFLADPANEQVVREIIAEEIAEDEAVIDYVYEERAIWAEVTLESITATAERTAPAGLVPGDVEPESYVWDEAHDAG